MKKIKHLAEYFAVLILLPVFKIIPYRIRLRFGSFIGIVLYYLYGRRREITFDNISKSFPGMDKTWHKNLCRNSFKHFGKSAMEFVHLRNFDAKFIADYITVEGEEHIKEALASGKGIIGICPHLGNWEFVAACIALKGYPVSVIMKRQSNTYINNMIERLRCSFKMELIYKKNSGFSVLRALKRNRIVAFVADQDAGRSGVFIDFFGRKASTAQGPARFALSHQSPVIIFAGVREEKGNFRIIISPILKFNYYKNDNAIYENTVLWTKLIEEYVTKYPEQYFWMHRRWKTKEV